MFGSLNRRTMSTVRNMVPFSVFLFVVFSGNVLALSTHGQQADGYVVDPKTGHRYKFHPMGATWIRAFVSCWSEGGYLTIINSEDEANFVKDLFNRYPKERITATWPDTASIGFYDADENRTWKTIRGDSLVAAGYSKFSDGQPNNTWGKQYCGAIFRNGQLDDFWCDATAPYVCEKDPVDTSSYNNCQY